jgi:hypothetical protein
MGHPGSHKTVAKAKTAASSHTSSSSPFIECSLCIPESGKVMGHPGCHKTVAKAKTAANKAGFKWRVATPEEIHSSGFDARPGVALPSTASTKMDKPRKKHKADKHHKSEKRHKANKRTRLTSTQPVTEIRVQPATEICADVSIGVMDELAPWNTYPEVEVPPFPHAYSLLEGWHDGFFCLGLVETESSSPY